MTLQNIRSTVTPFLVIKIRRVPLSYKKVKVLVNILGTANLWRSKYVVIIFRNILFLKLEIERNDVPLMKMCKKNLDTIQKFILRQTADNLEEFEKLKFDDFLNELSINKDDYIMALRGTVNQKMMFLPKRNCNELFINNYNTKILKDAPSNQDIQIIAGEEAAFAVATYAAKYISKDEAGQSKLLKRIEEESRLFGDSTDLQLKKLGKVLEDTREVSMQEVIFRLFGYNMCSSSRKKNLFKLYHQKNETAY